MAYTITRERDPDAKERICRAVLQSLPDWFGIEDDRIELARKYAKKLDRVLPAQKVLRFVQIENKLNTLVAMQAVLLAFTLHLRPGHKWSDGAPFTTKDFRYYWEDVANDPELSPTGPPQAVQRANPVRR